MSATERAGHEPQDEHQSITWQLAHTALSRLARERAAADAEEGRWLLAARRAAVHVHLGYGSFTEYIERLFGYRPRSIHEKLRVAEALQGLPGFARALASGDITWSAVRELTRVALPETEQEWLDFSRGKTLRQLEQVLAGKRAGDTPATPADPSAQRHVLRFEVAAETLALFRDALSELRRRAGAPLDDDSALLELARHVLVGPRDEGRASYQVVLHLCPECGSAGQEGAGELVPVGPDVLRMAHCDAQHVGALVEPSSSPANDLTPEGGDGHAREEVASASAGPAGVWTRPSPAGDAARRLREGAGTDSGHEVLVSREQHDPVAPIPDAHVSSRLSPSCPENSIAHVGTASPPADPRLRRGRARQSVPPALRRAVLLRDQRRCQVPGCSHSRWLDVHHLELRSEGGRHSLENLTCLCSAHHRAAHRGELTLARSADGALRVQHADGTEYGRRVQPQALELRVKVFSALRQLGFREGQVRAVLEQLQREPARASFDELLRAALARLCSRIEAR